MPLSKHFKAGRNPQGPPGSEAILGSDPNRFDMTGRSKQPMANGRYEYSDDADPRAQAEAKALYDRPPKATLYERLDRIEKHLGFHDGTVGLDENHPQGVGVGRTPSAGGGGGSAF